MLAFGDTRSTGLALLRETELHRALLNAIASGDVVSIRRLVAQGASLASRDSFRRTPLILAALEGINSREVVTTLVELGADVDAQSNNGRTALMEALARDDLAMAVALCECGASLSISDNGGRSAKSYARGRAAEAVVKAQTARPVNRGKRHR